MIATDPDCSLFIASYWSPKPGDKPRFHVVYAYSQGWNVIAGPESGENFTLAGTATRSPPISRGSLLIEPTWPLRAACRSSTGNRRTAPIAEAEPMRYIL